MKALVIGSGGREHAILWALQRTSKVPIKLYCAPGNGGISQLAECVPIKASDTQALLAYARATAIDLTIVGPEGPLAEGVVDEFERAGLRIVGPSASAAQLESSKAFAKEFMDRHAIPTAQSQVAHSEAEALQALRSGKFGPADSPVVIKADGLAAGKGVIMASTRVAGEQAVSQLLRGDLVSNAAVQKLVIEETLEGREVSVLLFADGSDYVLMPAARDHKRIGEGDTGPNTGGMGAITGSAVLDQQTLARVQSEIIEPTLKGAAQEGFPFKGILFVGLMLTAQGPKVLEYNVRFGDPETQAILMRLNSDLLEIFEAVVDGNIKNLKVEWTNGASACVVLASGGYPGTTRTGQTIHGLEQVPAGENLQVFHAGTALSEGNQFLTAGGRVLGITAAGDSLSEALERCYSMVSLIQWDGMQYRRDIGGSGLV